MIIRLIVIDSGKYASVRNVVRDPRAYWTSVGQEFMLRSSMLSNFGVEDFENCPV